MPETITFKPTRIRETFVVYMHKDNEDHWIKFVGVSKLSELFEFQDARCNSLWPYIFDKPDKEITMAIDSHHWDMMSAFTRQKELIRDLKPVCNIKGYNVAPHRQQILCHQTGELFNTVREVVAAHNVSGSALSNHLNRKIGFKTVKGRTYSRHV